MPLLAEKRENATDGTASKDLPEVRQWAHHMFRSRKKIEAANGQEASVETKYRCKACGHEWKVRVATNTRSG
jgi:hypothetical protein